MSNLTTIWHPSPNFVQRDEVPSFIILHGTWMVDDNSALQRLCDPMAEVSCHYFIDAQGQIFQLVKDNCTAWHAGKSQWGDLVSLNKYSIGIEISNPGDGTGELASPVDEVKPYRQQQYDVLIELLRDLQSKYNISPKNVLAHSDVSPGRKTDPGDHFNWRILDEAGVAFISREVAS